MANDLAYRRNHTRQALGQVAADLFGYHQQWPAAQIVDEILDDAWQWHPSVRIPHLRHQPGAVIDLDVAVDVQVARIQQADFEPMASEQCSQVHRLALLAELVQLATQRFDAGRLPVAHDRPEITAQHVLPRIDDLRPSQYLGYFENQHGEQAVFVYDRDSSQAIVYIGDAGWDAPYAVVDGAVPDLVLSETERLWVRVCWQAATANRKEA